MFSLFARARAQLNLSPGERAALKLVEGYVLAGAVAALPVVSQLLAQQTIVWAHVLRLAGGTFAVATLMAVSKYYKAQGDVPLEETVSAVADHIANATGLFERKRPGANHIASAAGLNDVKTLATPLPSVGPIYTNSTPMIGYTTTDGIPVMAPAQVVS